MLTVFHLTKFSHNLSFTGPEAWLQRGHLTSDGSIGEGAPEQFVEEDELSAEKAGAWFGETMIEAETHSCQQLLDRLPQEIVLCLISFPVTKAACYLNPGSVQGQDG